MNIFGNPHYDKHEKVVFGYDEASGLKAIIAVHNTYLGPALGGCRMYPYANEADALADVLRLSRGMTYKSALANLPLGGGKSVIIGNPAIDKKPALLEAMGRFVETVSGSYIVAKDMGIDVNDLALMAKHSSHVSGVGHARDENGGLRNGDPSPSTALGIYHGIVASVEYQLKRNSIDGLGIAIQGLGSVGYRLAQLLYDAGAELFVSDINSANEDRARREFGARVVEPDEILSLDVDVLSPCAMGAVINDDSISNIRARIIAGAANNQLASPSHGEQLFRRGILYAPDYVINAGGIIDAFYQSKGSLEHAGNAKELKAHVEGIADTLSEVFYLSRRLQKPTYLVADEMAEARFRGGERVLATA